MPYDNIKSQKKIKKKKKTRLNPHSLENEILGKTVEVGQIDPPSLFSVRRVETVCTKTD